MLLPSVLAAIFAFCPGHYLQAGTVCREWAEHYGDTNTLNTVCMSADSDDQCLQLLEQIGFPWECLALLTRSLAIRGYAHSLDHLSRQDSRLWHWHDVYDGAAAGGQIFLLDWCEQHCTPPNLAATAACYGHLPAVCWFKQRNFLWSDPVCSSAAFCGHMHILDWAVHAGYRMDSIVTTFAAARGDLKMLQWARRNGCGWDLNARSEAVLYGHKEIVDYIDQSMSPAAQFMRIMQNEEEEG